MSSQTALSQALEGALQSGDLALPPFPNVAQRVVEVAQDPQASASTIAKLVHRDAGLAAEVLRYANSAALGGGVEIVSVQQAISRLGIANVSEIALAASLRSGIYDAPAYSELIKRQWRQSLATALFAKRVARTAIQNVEVAFLCGLLWDVGATLVLHTIVPLAKRRHAPSQDEVEIQCETFGERFTGAAAEAWALPPLVSRALARRSAREADGSTPECAVALLATQLADLLLASDDALDAGSDEALDAGPLVGSVPAEALNLYPEQIESLCESAASVREELESMP